MLLTGSTLIWIAVSFAVAYGITHAPMRPPCWCCPPPSPRTWEDSPLWWIPVIVGGLYLWGPAFLAWLR